MRPLFALLTCLLLVTACQERRVVERIDAGTLEKIELSQGSIIDSPVSVVTTTGGVYMVKGMVSGKKGVKVRLIHFDFGGWAIWFEGTDKIFSPVMGMS